MELGNCSLCGRAGSSAFCPYCQAPIIKAEMQRQACTAQGVSENQERNKIEGDADLKDNRSTTSVIQVILRVLGAFGIAYAAYRILMGNAPLGPGPLGLLAGLVFLTVALMGMAWAYTHRYPAGRQSTISRAVLSVMQLYGAIVLVWLAGIAVFVVLVLFSGWH